MTAALILPDSADIAVEMGKRLLNDLGINLRGLDHVAFTQLDKYLNERGEELFEAVFANLEEKKKKQWASTSVLFDANLSRLASLRISSQSQAGLLDPEA